MNKSAIDEQKQEARSIVGNYLAVSGGRIASIFLSAAVLAIVTRSLGPEKFGTLSIFFMVCSFFTTIFINWQNSAITRFGREEYIQSGNISRTMGAGFLIFSAAYLVAVVLIFSFRKTIVNYIGVGEVYIFLVSLFVLTGALYEISFYLLQSVGKLKIYSLLPVAEKMVTLVVFYFLSRVVRSGKVGSLTLTEVVSGFAGGHLVVISVAFTLLFLSMRQHLQFDFSYVKKIIFYAWSMFIGALTSFVVNWVDVIFIKKYQSMTDVGVYSLAFKAQGFFLLLIMATIPLTMPVIVSLRTLGHHELIKRYVDELIPQGVFAWSIILSVLIVLSDFFIGILFGERYLPAAALFSVLMIGVAFNAISAFYSGFTSAYDIVAPVVGISVVISIIKTAGDIVVIPHFGVMGAAVVSAFSVIVGNVLYIPVVHLWGKKEIGVKPARYMVVLWALPVLLSCIVVLFEKNLLSRLLLCLILLTGYLYLAIKIGLFKRDTIELIDKLNIPLGIKKYLVKFYALFV